MASMLAEIANFVYPPRCAGCGVRFGIESRRRMCQACLTMIGALDEPLCAICGGPLEPAGAGGDLCSRCVRHRPSYGRAFAIARYSGRSHADGSLEEGLLASLIRRHKYGLNQALGLALLECLGDTL